MQKDIKTVAGCFTNVTCNVTATDGREVELTAYIAIGKERRPVSKRGTNVFIFPAVEYGQHLYEIRADGKPLIFGFLLVRPSAFPVEEGTVDYTLNATLDSIDALHVDIELTPGPRGYSAYDIAVMEGFEGSAAEWLESMRQKTATLAVEQVTPLIERAETAAGDAKQFATDASNSLAGAKSFARGAEEEADRADAAADKAAQHEDTVRVLISDAEAHEQAAAKSAQDALANKQGAEKAAQDAAQAQVGAEQAKADADAAKTEAQTAEGNAKASANAAAADKTAAEKAKADAQAAQTKAAQEASNAEQNAALLGDAALKGADNEFIGLNRFAAMTQFPAGAGFESGIPWIAATAMAFGVPPLAAYAETWKEYRQLSDIDSITSGQSVCIFAPCMNADSGEYFNTSRFSRDVFFVSGRMVNFCSAKRIRAVTFSDVNYAMVNPYRCEDIQLLHVGKATGILIWWNHNLFSKAPDLNIYAPNLTKVTTGVLIQSLNSVGTARIKLPSFNSNFTLKIGAIQKDDVLYLLQNLPTMKAGVSRTAAISCDPALETDEDFLAQVAAFYDAETKTGWNVALTFQGNAIDAVATTYSMRRMTPPIFAMREECSGGAYVDADGTRWAIFSGSWVVDENCGYTEFPTIEAALAEWGLREYQPEE